MDKREREIRERWEGASEQSSTGIIRDLLHLLSLLKHEHDRNVQLVEVMRETMNYRDGWPYQLQERVVAALESETPVGGK